MGLMDNAGKALANMTSSGGSSLQGFLSKFNSSEGLYVNQIDTLHTFDISFAFWPCKKVDGEDEDSWDSFFNNIGDAALGAAKNLLNNATGGLFGAAMNSGKVTDDKKYDKEMTVLDYIAKGNMIADDSTSDQLVVDMSYYVQNIQLPQITMKENGSSETLYGQFPVNGSYIQPSQNTFTMEILNTKAPIAERIFYPWMREVTLPYWSYKMQPYTTADVTVSFEKHSDNKYLFVGCRPSQIETMRGSNELGSPIRSVTMMFDYMFVLSDLERCGKVGDALLDAGKSLLGGGTSMLGL